MTHERSEIERKAVIRSSQAVGADADIGRLTSVRRRRRRTDWREGGRAVSRWDASVVAAAAVGGGLGVLGALVVGRIQEPSASVASLSALWGGMLGAVAFALLRSMPAGLLRLRPQDLLWGVGLGVALRMTQGLINQANTSNFPVSVGSTSKMLLFEATASGFVGPLAEELFFRGVVLVALYQLFRRSAGSRAAACAATIVSTGAFVSLHSVFMDLGLNDGVQLTAVGLTCSLLVLATGRLWGAVLTHVVYNCSFLVLAAIGSTLAL